MSRRRRVARRVSAAGWAGWVVLMMLATAAGVHAAPAPAAPSAPTEIQVHAALSGEVIPLQLAVVGQSVKQGDPLLFVRSSTGGAVPAARAPVDGQVTQVLVRPGDRVNIGDVVAVVRQS